MKYLFPGVVLFILLACGTDSTSSNNQTSSNGTLDTPFPAFSGFPTFQFEQILLGDSTQNIRRALLRMDVDLLSEANSSHFRFSEDSTAIILPDTPLLGEFKVYLRSAKYLSEEALLRTHFEKCADRIADHAHFPVFYYDLKKYSFRMSYFNQPESIRLHFLVNKKRS